jgi:hypothetical protein
MTKLDNCGDRRIDLGQASAETKGTAILDFDPGGGQLRYVMGLADE